ncbi:hypothetical protein SAMN05518863_10160 [Candidatus Pantoea symbiotica]|jgi:hypothetical protein|uniref:Uncharacterized protein n=1 Tax=Candidatus Pantoea symbiotica TaxID=1884370 RepID=A0A1I3Q949_9GAMM|nr:MULTISPECIES: hypothetical protein [Pantoea]SFJ30428.1 hypothetical protein SAMN05518863_10160 [Pantoea symbiotica]SFU30353.1 hypothetical protein SAMN05518864_10160 [Pantoea sp. YR525]
MPVTQHTALTLNNEDLALSQTHHLKGYAAISKSSQSLDEVEAEERHGGQYHLRHHLSGCSQTLHVIDFSEIVASGSAPADSTLSLMPNENAQQTTAMAANTHIGDSPVELLAATVMPQPLLAEFASNIQNGNVTFDASEDIKLSRQQTANETITLRELKAITEYNPITSSAENLENSVKPGAVDNNMQYDNWQINDSIETQLNENGQLVINDSLVENSTLLTQKLQISANSHYQFNMRMIMDDHSEPPAFSLNVDGQEILLTAVRVAEGYQLRGEFTSSDTDTKTISLVAKSPLASGHHLYIDHLVFEVMLPKPVSVHLPEETVFDFAAITVIEPEIISNKAEVTFTDKNLLVDVHAELAITPAVEPSEAMADITLDSISGDVKAEHWNTIATNESVALMIMPTEVELQINPLEEQL